MTKFLVLLTQVRICWTKNYKKSDKYLLVQTSEFFFVHLSLDKWIFLIFPQPCLNEFQLGQIFDLDSIAVKTHNCLWHGHEIKDASVTCTH